MKRIGNETFSESIDGYKVPDVGFYIATGVNAMERREMWRATYRLHLDLDSGAVRWELLATFHVRLLQYVIDRDGERVGLFAGRGRDGQGFIFRLRERNFQNTKAIGRVIYSASGAGGGFIVPGCARAFIRAVLQLSEEGEIIPQNPTDEGMAHLLNFYKDGDTLDTHEEINPFDDDFHDPWNYPSDYPTST